MEAMAKMEDNAFELAIVDPPYGIDIFERSRTTNGNKNHRLKDSSHNSVAGNWYKWEDKGWDYNIPKKSFFKELFRTSKHQIIWGANFYNQHLNPSKSWIVWKKLSEKFAQTSFELAWTSHDKPGAIFDYNQGQENGCFKHLYGGRIHPTQKPVKLYKWLLKNYANEGDKILDTHLGSGSIAIACHDMGFDLEGYEIDQEYHQAALQRLNTHRSQLQMF